jgi:glutamine---fructose-6-phosphate transaminase (isomerizing)
MTAPTAGPRDLDALLTWREAATAGPAIEAAVQAAVGPPGDAAARILEAADQVVVTGAGSSYYLAQSVAAAGRAIIRAPFIALPLSELLLRPASVLTARSPATQPVIVISRSGSTSEAVSVANTVRSNGHPTIGVTCRGDSPVARLANVALVSPYGDEDAVVMTRSFASMLALLLRLIATVGHHAGLAAGLEAAAGHWRESLVAAATGRELAATDWSRVVVLGGGPRSGIATEWALKLLETSQIPVSAYEPLEFRHGPISVCEPGVLVVMLVGGDGASEEVRVLDEARRLGATGWLLAGDVSEAGTWAGDPARRLSLVGEGLDPTSRLPLLLTPGHALALGLALTRGRDPDAPRHLDQVVVFEPG